MQKKLIKLLNSRFVFAIAFLLVFVGGFGVRLYKINGPLADWHSWRQVDTASVSKSLLENGFELLRPRYHDISKIQTGYFNPDGYRMVEFPVFNVFHAGLFRILPIFSFEAWGRLVSIFSALLTALFIYKTAKIVFNSRVGLASAFYYLFLPYNVYFTRIILPDPMSVMFSMASVYFFASYTNSKKVTSLLLSAILLGVAVLVKPHAMFFAIPIVFLVLSRLKTSELFKNKWHFVALDLAIIPFLLWRIWIYREGFIRGIPYWEWAFNGNGIRFRPSFWKWIFAERVGKIILGSWGVFPFVYAIVSSKKMFTLVHAFLLATFLYLAIFASANVMHDYYQIFIVPSIALALGFGAYSIWTNKDFNPVLSKLAVLAVTLGMFFVSFYEVRDHFRVNDTGIVDVGRVADDILPKDALVIAPYNGDTTFLYQTKRWGWPIVTESIDELIDKGADYFISVNFSDPDVALFKSQFEVVIETDRYIIIDLNKRKQV